MKYTMAQVMRKIRGSEGKIEDAKMAIWNLSRIVKKKGLLPAGILSGLAVAAGATLGFFMLKKNGSHHQKKKLEEARAKELAHRKGPLDRLLGAIAFVSTVSTIVGTMSRITKVAKK